VRWRTRSGFQMISVTTIGAQVARLGSGRAGANAKLQPGLKCSACDELRPSLQSRREGICLRHLDRQPGVRSADHVHLGNSLMDRAHTFPVLCKNAAVSGITSSTSPLHAHSAASGRKWQTHRALHDRAFTGRARQMPHSERPSGPCEAIGRKWWSGLRSSWESPQSTRSVIDSGS